VGKDEVAVACAGVPPLPVVRCRRMATGPSEGRHHQVGDGGAGNAPPPKLSTEVERVELLDVGLLCAVPMVVVFAGTFLSRFGYRRKTGAPWTLTTHYLSLVPVGFVVAALLLVGYLFWLRRGLLRGGGTDDLLSPWRADGRWRLWLTFWSFMIGSVVGALLRFYLGPLVLSGFFQGTTPVMAGLVVGIIFSTTGIPRSDRAAYRQRQLGVIYVLIGALAGAGGSTPGEGWLYGTCFVVIWGSLVASSYVVMNLIFGTEG